MENSEFKQDFKKRIYALILKIIKLIELLPKNDDVCRITRNQLIRSSTSIGANYIEAIAGSSRKDFTNFLSYSLKSANESKFWLALPRDTNKGNKDQTQVLLKELIEISNILGSSIRTLKMKKF